MYKDCRAGEGYGFSGFMAIMYAVLPFPNSFLIIKYCVKELMPVRYAYVILPN